MNPLPPRLPSRASSTEPTPPTSGRWLDDLMRNFERLVSRAHTLHHTHVLPCVIEGRRALVHERGLEHREPAVYAWLRRFCETNDIRLQADRRSEAVPVARERRRHLAPVVALAASLLVPGMAAAVDAADLPAGSDGVRFGAVASLPVRDGGTRFLAGPHGDVSNILHIAAEARARGVPQRVSTAGLQVPDNTLNGIVTRYDYSYPADCGGERFSFFEGHDFRALGHFQGDKVVIDVLAGGGPFTAPRLWGPFDQVQNDTVDMHLVVGNGEQDSFGLMRASFSVGLVAELPAERQASYGHAYEAATRRSAKCELPALPVAPPEPVIAPLLSAGAGTPAGAGNARISAMTIGAGPADDTRANEVSAPSGRDLFGAVDHLPVRDHGKRFVATPQGEVADIRLVAAEVKRLGTVASIDTKRLKLPLKSLNPRVLRYDHEFMTSAGPLKFSVYEGNGFSALGYHDGDRIVLDVLDGGALSAPRLWGTYDQVLNDDSEQLMDALIADGESDGFGMLKAAFVVGVVSRMPEDARIAYGKAYAEAVDTAARGIDGRDQGRISSARAAQDEPVRLTYARSGEES